MSAELPVPVTWVRLPHGRLWHLRAALSVTTTFCGEKVTKKAETLVSPPPDNAWVCRSCTVAVVRLARLAEAAYNRDPRPNRGPSTDPIVDAEVRIAGHDDE